MPEILEQVIKEMMTASLPYEMDVYICLCNYSRSEAKQIKSVLSESHWVHTIYIGFEEEADIIIIMDIYLFIKIIQVGYELIN